MYTAGRLFCRLNFLTKHGGLYAGFLLGRSELNFSFFVDFLLKENQEIIQKHT